MRIALLTLEALAAAQSVRRFVRDNADRIALVGLSDVHRPAQGDARAQEALHWRRSGPGIFPYLAANFTCPHFAPPLWRLARDPPVERTPLPVVCARLGLPVETVTDVNAGAFQARLRASGAELIVTYHFDQILRADTLEVVKRGGINVHAGLLPHHRGPVPTIHALMEDQPAFGVTVHRLTPAIDDGPILAQAILPMSPRASAVTAARRLHALARPLLERSLADMAAGQERAWVVPPLPYCGWPDRTALRRLAGRRRAVARLSDFVEALRTPI